MEAMAIRIELDSVADAAYIRLSEHAVEKTVELTDDVLVDMDEFGVAVGVEVLGLHVALPFERLMSECHIRSEVVEHIKLIRPSVAGFVLHAEQHSAGIGTPTRAQMGEVISA